MKSPFPGMDPYLERHWPDVHTLLVAFTSEALNEVLPADLVARTEERIYVEADGVASRSVAPDVRVVEHVGGWQSATGGPQGGCATPVLLDIGAEPMTERYVEILETDGRRVITAIELISPSNKVPGEGRESYMKKRREFLASSTNLVEIDLVRGGNWMELLAPYRVPPELRTTYRVSIRRAARPEKAEFYPISLREALPTISIPLRPSDDDVRLNLQAMFDHAYRAGRYAVTDYAQPCEPPLDAVNAAWAEELLRRAGRR